MYPESNQDDFNPMSTFDRPTSTVMGSRAGFLDIILQIVRSMLRFLSNYKIMSNDTPPPLYRHYIFMGMGSLSQA